MSSDTASWPRSSKYLMRLMPRKPAPPVTRTFMLVGAISFVILFGFFFRAVAQKHYPGRVRLRLYKLKLHLVVDVAEERLAATQKHRVNQHLVFVDQAQVGKLLYYARAPIYQDVAARFLFQALNLFRNNLS